MENVGKREKDHYLISLIKDNDHDLFEKNTINSFGNKKIFASSYTMKSNNNSLLLNIESTRKNGLARKGKSGAESIYDKCFQEIDFQYFPEEIHSIPEVPFSIALDLDKWKKSCDDFGIVDNCRDPILKEVYDSIRNDSNYVMRDYVFFNRRLIVENDGFQHQLNLKQFLKDLITDDFLQSLYNLITIRLVTCGNKVNKCKAIKNNKGDINFFVDYNKEEDNCDTRVLGKLATYFLNIRNEKYEKDPTFLKEYLYDQEKLILDCIEIRYEEFCYVRWIIEKKFDILIDDNYVKININFLELKKAFPNLEKTLIDKIKNRFKKITKKDLCILF
jgi:hypothetical protein